MMKRILLLTIIALQTSTAFAQDKDISTAEFYYRLTYLTDTINRYIKEDFMVLRLNNEKSIFFSQSNYERDSLLLSDKGDAIRADMFVNGVGKYKTGPIYYTVLKDFTNKNLTFTDNVGGDYMKYEEDLPQFDWKLTNEQKTIGDYSCQKAVCDFRGRTYEAWFTTEIPISNGPWKFHGLPGLILEVSDTKREYRFEFAYNALKKAPIRNLPQKFVNTTRKKYLKTNLSFMKDPIGYLTTGTGIEIAFVNGKPFKNEPKKLLYNQMELE